MKKTHTLAQISRRSLVKDRKIMISGPKYKTLRATDAHRTKIIALSAPSSLTAVAVTTKNPGQLKYASKLVLISRARAGDRKALERA